MAFLELRGVAKGYGSGRARLEVLRGIDLEVERGEFLAVVGYSGSGKTTLLSLIAGLVRPDSGQVLLDGRPVLEPGPDRGVVFQSYSLLPWLTVQENVALGVDQVFPSWPAGKRRAHVERHISLVNLTAARHKRPAELSGGMRQRVAVARALALDPEVLLLDEPFGALDALTRATLQDELEALWERERKTVVLVTNDVDEAVLLADRIVPLTIGPGATLGPAVAVGLPRPRDRKAVNHDARFKEIRGRVIEYLLGPGRRRPAATVDPVAAAPGGAALEASA
jgi:nitrate/nitrite transport system ATP-binding protein